MQNQNKIVYQTARGYILQCQNCETFQVGFGNIVIGVQSIESLDSIRRKIDVITNDEKHFDSPIDKNVYLRVSLQGFGYALSTSELIEFKELLNMGLSSLLVNDLIEDVFSN